MKTQNSSILSEAIEVFPGKVAKVFLFKNIVIVEAKEGIHFSEMSSEDILLKIKSFYGTENKIGIIANRINTYSIEVFGYNKIQEMLPNISAYGVVFYDIKNAYSLEIEKVFTKIPVNGFTDLIEAYEKTKALLKN